MRYAFAGDRNISVQVLNFLISQGHEPLALLVTEGKTSTHSKELIDLVDLKEEYIFSGKEFNNAKNIEKLKDLELDYIFGIHFPYILSEEALNIPKIGFLNLHPAFLPFNKGWHTPSWAIIDKTPYGATLHFMTKELDAGDIIHQRQISILPNDTADSLYAKTLELELKVFKEALPSLISLQPQRLPQSSKGTRKSKKDLSKVQEIDLSQNYTGEEILDKLRALTTNSVEEAAYFVKDGKKFAVQVVLKEIST